MTGFNSEALGLLRELVRLLRELVAEVRGLRRALRTPVEPDPAVALLLHVIAEETHSRPFSVSELLEYAEVVPALHAAIEGCGARNGKRLGKLLARIAGQSYEGWCIERKGETREGAMWVCAGLKLAKPVARR